MGLMKRDPRATDSGNPALLRPSTEAEGRARMQVLNMEGEVGGGKRKTVPSGRSCDRSEHSLARYYVPPPGEFPPRVRVAVVVVDDSPCESHIAPIPQKTR